MNSDSSEAPRTDAYTARDRTLDIARGLAILAVVFGHVLGGLAPAGVIWKGSETFQVVNNSLYLTHLALFSFITGVFIPKSVNRLGPSLFVRTRTLLYAYLFLVWTAITGLFTWVANHLGDGRSDALVALKVWMPVGQLWYFPLLILAVALVAYGRPWSRTIRSNILTVIVMAASVAMWGINSDLAFTKGLSLIGFFWLGSIVGFSGMTSGLRRLSSPRALALSLIALGVLIAISSFWDPLLPTAPYSDRTWNQLFLGMAGTACGIVGVLAASKVFSHLSVISRSLAYVGERSLEIFLAHAIFIAATRVVLLQLGDAPMLVHVCLGTLVGILGPLLLTHMARVSGQTWLFQLPKRAVSTERRAARRHT
jgi:fucose 4-O-acetylase-like acetyltransferase